MAATIKSPVSIGLILFYTVAYVSSAQHSNILSSLYKKAGEDNRPLILVLDKSVSSNALTAKSDYSAKNRNLPKLHDYQARPRPERGNELSLLLKQLGLGSSLSKKLGTRSRHSKSIIKNRSRSGNRDKTRLRSRADDDDRTYLGRREDRRDSYRDDRLNRERRDRARNYRERLHLSRYYNRHDQDRYDPDGREELDTQVQNKYDRYRARADGRNRARHYREIRDRPKQNRAQNRNYLERPRYDRDRRDRIRDYRDKRERSRNENSYKVFLEKNYKDSFEDGKETMKERVLRTSVIKNFLRYSNDLNCDALDECAAECDATFDPEEADECVRECEIQFECEDISFYQQRADVEDCDFADSCADSTQTGTGLNPSTRGVLLEDLTEDTKNLDDDCEIKEEC